MQPDFPLRAPLRRALLVTAAVAALLLCDFFVLRPLQEQGLMDLPAVLANVICSVVSFPGMLVGRFVYTSKRLWPLDPLTVYYLSVAAVASLFYGAVAFVLLRRRQVRFPELPEERRDRRRMLGSAVKLGVLGSAGALAGYSVLVEPRWPRLTALSFPLRGLPPALDGLRVLHLSDLHLGRYNSASYLRSVVARCSRLEADLVLLTGDFVHGSPEFFQPVAAVLSRLRSRLGSLAVLGNHDHWEGADLARKALQGAGVRMVENRPLLLTAAGLGPPGPGSAGGPGLCISGIGDFWEGDKDLDAAFAGIHHDTPRLLLSHNPDFAESRQACSGKHRVDLMLAGHTHGGQVRLPGTRGLIIPSGFGTKYARGLVQGPAFPVFVTTGVGVTIIPVRLLVRPEIALITLRTEA